MPDGAKDQTQTNTTMPLHGTFKQRNEALNSMKNATPKVEHGLTPQSKYSISVYNGDFFDFKNPEKHKFDIETIAHSLSNICRYTGHCKKFYSVAEHCILVSKLVPEKYAFEGLMHDASEAYCGDVASPLKAMFPSYKRLENKIEKALSEYFGFQFPFPPEVKLADDIAYRTEKLQIADNTADDLIWKKAEANNEFKLQCWGSRKAKEKFLERFEELRNGQRIEQHPRQAA